MRRSSNSLLCGNSLPYHMSIWKLGCIFSYEAIHILYFSFSNIVLGHACYRNFVWSRGHVAMDRVVKALVLVAGCRFGTPEHLQSVSRRLVADPDERRRRVERRLQSKFAALALVAGSRFGTPEHLQAVSRRGVADPDERLLRAHRGIQLPLGWTGHATHPQFSPCSVQE